MLRNAPAGDQVITAVSRWVVDRIAQPRPELPPEIGTVADSVLDGCAGPYQHPLLDIELGRPTRSTAPSSSAPPTAPSPSFAMVAASAAALRDAVAHG